MPPIYHIPPKDFLCKQRKWEEVVSFRSFSLPSPVNLVTLYYDNVYALSPPVLQCNAMVNTGLFVREWVHREGKREEGGYTGRS